MKLKTALAGAIVAGLAAVGSVAPATATAAEARTGYVIAYHYASRSNDYAYGGVQAGAQAGGAGVGALVGGYLGKRASTLLGARLGAAIGGAFGPGGAIIGAVAGAV